MQTAVNRKCSRIKTIEQVEVKLSLKFLPRAFMLMYLTSPNGTKSQLLYPRIFDAITRRDKYNNLVVSSLHFWGENPNGGWTVLFRNSRNWFRRKGRRHAASYSSSHFVFFWRLGQDIVSEGTAKKFAPFNFTPSRQDKKARMRRLFDDTKSSRDLFELNMLGVWGVKSSIGKPNERTISSPEKKMDVYFFCVFILLHA